jgi:hypothetical protein
LNLGVDFDLPREHWKDFANCVEETITGQTPLVDYPKAIRALARRYARKIVRQQACVVAQGEGLPADYATVDLNSVLTVWTMKRPEQLALSMLFMRPSRNLG